MKKLTRILATLLALTIASTSFVACSKAPTDNNSSSSSETTPGTTLTEGSTLEDIVNSINEEIGLQMPSPVDEVALNDLFHITSDMTEEFSGLFAMVMTSSDNVIAVKAAPGKIVDVTAALEQRKTDLVESFSQYLPDQFEKAQAGKVITKGDYAFLIILGDYEKGFDNEVAKAEEIINSFFN
ncbi:MAG: DUF4358 domain-containing protein [Cellulosilyticaceae bacterium]